MKNKKQSLPHSKRFSSLSRIPEEGNMLKETIDITERRKLNNQDLYKNMKKMFSRNRKNNQSIRSKSQSIIVRSED